MIMSFSLLDMLVVASQSFNVYLDFSMAAWQHQRALLGRA